MLRMGGVCKQLSNILLTTASSSSLTGAAAYSDPNMSHPPLPSISTAGQMFLPRPLKMVNAGDGGDVRRLVFAEDVECGAIVTATDANEARDNGGSPLNNL